MILPPFILIPLRMLTDCMTNLLCLRKMKLREINPHQVTPGSSQDVIDRNVGLQHLIACSQLCTLTSAVLTERLSCPIALKRLRPTKI